MSDPLTDAKSRALVVASHFPPRQSAGVYRTLRFVRYLPELGWDVHVLTINSQSYGPGATVDEGLLRKVPACVTVHRTSAVYPMQWLERVRRLVPRRNRTTNTTPQQNSVDVKSNGRNGDATRGIVRRLKDALTLPLMTPDRMTGWIPFAVRRGKSVIRQHGVDVLYSSGPPWSNHLIGMKLKRATGRPWVADFRDPWVGSDYRSQRREDTWAGRKHRRLERGVIEAANVVVVNTARSRENMLERHADLPAEKVCVIPNGYDPADYDSRQFSPRKRGEETDRSRLLIAHAGSFYGRRSVGTFIEALGNICRRGDVPREKIAVQLIGALRAGRTTEQEQVRDAGLDDVVQLLPAVTHEASLQKLADADVLLLIQTEAPLCVPGKVFEYIALGKPVFTLSGEGSTADLVCDEALGPRVDPLSVPCIEAALVELYQQFAAGNLKTSISADTRARFDGRRLTQKLDDVLRKSLETETTCLP